MSCKYRKVRAQQKRGLKSFRQRLEKKLSKLVESRFWILQKLEKLYFMYFSGLILLSTEECLDQTVQNDLINQIQAGLDCQMCIVYII